MYGSGGGGGRARQPSREEEEEEYYEDEQAHEQDYEDQGDEYREDEEAADEKPGLSIPRVKKEDPDDDDGLLSPRRVFQQVDAFSQMLDSGAGWGSALVAAVQGHKMTEEQAALAIQSHWRKKAVYLENGANGMAADFIINIWRKRQYRQRAQAAMARGRAQREYYEQMEAEADAATTINAAWRGHMDRERVKVLRARARGGVGAAIRRSLSFGKKKGGGGLAARTSTGDGDDEKKDGIGKRIRRSLSFDRKGGGGLFGGSGKDDEEKNKVATRSTRRTFVLERGPQGLGLELDATNTVVTIKVGGRAERQGLLCVGDTVLTIDGKSCAGLLMQDVMVPGRQCYVVEISRPEMTQAPPTPSGLGSKIRRSMSFDKKAAGGIRRSYSWTNRK